MWQIVVMAYPRIQSVNHFPAMQLWSTTVLNCTPQYKTKGQLVVYFKMTCNFVPKQNMKSILHKQQETLCPATQTIVMYR
jgi:hypothetical protein